MTEPEWVFEDLDLLDGGEDFLQSSIPTDLIVHTGHTDIGSDRSYSPPAIFSPWSVSSADESADHSNERADDLDLAPQQEELGFAQFGWDLNLINSTISQDQTAGAEQTINTLLLLFAQRLAKQDEMSFAKPTEDRENLPTDLGPHSSRPGASNQRENKGGAQSERRRAPLPSMINHRSEEGDYAASYDDEIDYEEFNHLLRPPLTVSLDGPDLVVEREAMLTSPRYMVEANDLTPGPRNRHIGRERIRRVVTYEGSDTFPDPRNDYHATTTEPHTSGKSLSGSEETQKIISNPYKQFQEQALSATDADLRDMQKVFANLSTNDRAKLAASELDPVTYYFTHLKDRSGGNGMVFSPTPSIRERLEAPNNAEEPQRGKHLEESKEKAVSEKLHTLQQRISPRDQLRLLEQSFSPGTQSQNADMSVCSPRSEVALESNITAQDSVSVISSSNHESNQTLASSVTEQEMAVRLYFKLLSSSSLTNQGLRNR